MGDPLTSLPPTPREDIIRIGVRLGLSPDSKVELFIDGFTQ